MLAGREGGREGSGGWRKLLAGREGRALTSDMLSLPSALKLSAFLVPPLLQLAP